MADHVVEPLDAYGPAELRAIVGDEVDPFQAPADIPQWRPKIEHLGLRVAGRLAGHVGLVEVPVAVGDRELGVAGFGGVIVASALRGKGFARELMTVATERARRLGPEFGLLFCHGSREGFYAKLGWRRLRPGTPITVLQQGVETAMPMRTMWLPLHEAREWPPGPVRLLSPPM